MGQIRAQRPLAWAIFVVTLLCAWVWAEPTRAFSSLFERVRQDATLAASLPESETKAEVYDGLLLGTGSERLRRLPDGRLRIDRTRHYTRIRHPESGKIVALPQPWSASSVLIVQPSLRLVSSDTRYNFKREADNILGDYKLSEHHEWMFESDRSVVRASTDGKTLTRQSFLGGQSKKNERYDYPPHSMPVEILGLLLAVAVQRRVDQFDFELIVPGGSTHGVRAQVHRTRDVTRFAKGYRVPKKNLIAPEPLAVIDMRLASPVKYIFFPHHFYLAYSEREPWKLMMMWGGDPDKTIQAFRID
jgi:hypothetical protein